MKVAAWLDTYGGVTPATIGRGKRNGDEIHLLFKDKGQGMILKYWSAIGATTVPKAGNHLRRLPVFAFAAGLMVFGLVDAPQICAQSPQATGASLPSFEVASIKPDRSGDVRSMMQTRPAGLSASGATTKKLIALAYNVEEFQVSRGPSWISSEKYYVEAKVEDSIVEQQQKLPYIQQEEQIRLMVQSLLVDRFKRKVSHATKELPVYALERFRLKCLHIGKRRCRSQTGIIAY
jgi:hypothetical protein